MTDPNLRLDAVLAVGGEGTLTVANVLCDAGLHIVGVPKTIDNDIGATDYSFGFNTAVEIATEAIDRLHTTAQSHRRCMVVEVMGRHVGWIALHAGIAGGAHVILVPEKTIGTAVMLQRIRQVHDRGEAPIVVVAEGFIPEHEDGPLVRDKVDAFDRPLLGGVGEALAHSIQKETAIETRAVVIGHIQRGGTPSAYDRVSASRLGVAAVQAALNGRWGDMVALSGRNIVTVPIANAISGLNVVPIARMEEAEWLLG